MQISLLELSQPLTHLYSSARAVLRTSAPQINRFKYEYTAFLTGPLPPRRCSHLADKVRSSRRQDNLIHCVTVMLKPCSPVYKTGLQNTYTASADGHWSFLTGVCCWAGQLPHTLRAIPPAGQFAAAAQAPQGDSGARCHITQPLKTAQRIRLQKTSERSLNARLSVRVLTAFHISPA